MLMMTSEVSGRHAVPVDEPAEPEVPERARRRVFSAQYKLRILTEYERRDRDGRSALLRREGHGVVHGPPTPGDIVKVRPRRGSRVYRNHSRGHSVTPSVQRSLACCTRSASSIRHPPLATPRCWMKVALSVQCRPCTACCA